MAANDKTIDREDMGMHAFNLVKEQEWDPKKHVEKVLAELVGRRLHRRLLGARPDQPAPLPPALHRDLFLLRGRRQDAHAEGNDRRACRARSCVHPPGEVHEYINGPKRTMLFRVRHGTDMSSRHIEWRGHPEFQQSARDAEYYRLHPPV